MTTSGGGYSYPLNTNAGGVLNSAGYAVVSIGPTNPYEVWTVGAVAINADVTTNTPTCNVYLGNGPNGQLLAGPYNGAQNSANISVTLYTGQKICAVFSGGDPGAAVGFAVQGTVNVP